MQPPGNAKSADPEKGRKDETAGNRKSVSHRHFKGVCSGFQPQPLGVVELQGGIRQVQKCLAGGHNIVGGVSHRVGGNGRVQSFHAEEVSVHLPTGCVAAGESGEAVKLVQDAFMNRNFRVYTSPDIVGVELGGALKNVVALSCGICDGMGYQDNTKALLMTRAMRWWTESIWENFIRSWKNGFPRPGKK